MVIFGAIVDKPSVPDSRGPYKYRFTVPLCSRYVPQRSGTLERSGTNVPERVEHAVQTFQVDTFEKRSKLSRYLPKTLWLERSKKGSNVLERVPGTFRNAFQKTFQKRSNVLERVPKSVPAFHSVPGTVLAVQERSVGFFECTTAPISQRTTHTIIPGLTGFPFFPAGRSDLRLEPM